MTSQRIFPITMPKWGIEMQQGTITNWYVEPGRQVAKGEPLLDVETEKIVNSVEAPVTGVVRLIVAEKGSTESVGALIAVIADPSVSDTDLTDFVGNFKPVDASFDLDLGSSSGHPPPAAAGPATADHEDAPRISPIARRTAERLAVDIGRVRGTGHNGRISKEDVEAYAAANAQSHSTPVIADGPQPARAKMTAMRATIAKRLVESTQTIPHYRLSVDVDFAALLRRRAVLNAAGGAITLNDLIVRATALALMQQPPMNSLLIDDEILTYPHADICVAVATEGGLMTPVVRAAEAKSAAEISLILKDLAEKAQTGRLTRNELSGGTFTISNLGMYGIDRFDAIINPPQVGILAVGAVGDRMTVAEGQPRVVKSATLTLSADHRVIDGAIGARFLATLKDLIQAAEPL